MSEASRGDEHSDDGSERLGNRESGGDARWDMRPKGVWMRLAHAITVPWRRASCGGINGDRAEEHARDRLSAGCRPGQDALREPKDGRRALPLDAIDRERPAEACVYNVVGEAEPEARDEVERVPEIVGAPRP